MRSTTRSFPWLLALSMILGAGWVATGAPGPTTARPATAASRCPWVASALAHRATPGRLANEVVAHLTLAQKADLVVLAVRGRIENANVGVPGLCLPDLTLTDGPVGVGSGLRGVTQFPSELAVAASFDPALARAVGAAMGAETRAKGLDVLQGPNLNLVRAPLSGRAFETYGEDPYLVAAMGVAAIEGIQSTGTLADAKHFGAYTQETARGVINQLVSPRALAEVYNLPFEAAVTRAHVASLMCAMGSLNGVNTCSDPSLYATLRRWGFRGFVRTDYLAVTRPLPAFSAGVDLIKPASSAQLVAAVAARHLRASSLTRAARDVVRVMFAWGLITHPRTPHPLARAATPAHAALALRAAIESAVLLKNDGVLPLSHAVHSVAVIGVDAQVNPITRGGGSSGVTAPFVVTPLSALRRTLGPGVAVTYSPGGRPALELDQLRYSDLLAGKPLPHLKALPVEIEPGKADLSIDYAPRVTAATATATAPGTGEGWSHWRAQLKVHVSGTYEVGLQQTGDTWLTLNGAPVISSPGVHGPTVATATVNLLAGHHYTLEARWLSVSPKVEPKLGLSDVSGYIARAVAAAKSARVAIVFASSYATEGADQTSLTLPGDSNALISAVAKVNPRTIVVLNTGGAVTMPWLSHVAAVLEDWYPGEQDGRAAAALLTGAANPSGALPITFPRSLSAQPAASPASFPGVHSTVSFGGLDVGYRWYQAHSVAPLFPFGFQLSYTHFHLGATTLRRQAGGVLVSLPVANVGGRRGAVVVQAYVHFPSGAGEPPEQLRAFARVDLAPGGQRVVTLSLPRSDFASWNGRTMTVPSGQFRIDVGTSSAQLVDHVSLSLP